VLVTGATEFIAREWCRRAQVRGDRLIVMPAREIGASLRIDAIVNLTTSPASRIDVTNDVVDLIERLAHKPAVLVSLSSIDYYGTREEEVTEADRGQPVRKSQVCQIWELAAQRARQHGVRECRLRVGLVLGTTLRVASMPWIHIDDLLRMIDRALDDGAWSGPFNATSPQSAAVMPLKARCAGFEFEYPARSRKNRRTAALPATPVP
jgi:NAD dependent epimerase/dehydratase family enzyme